MLDLRTHRNRECSCIGSLFLYHKLDMNVLLLVFMCTEKVVPSHDDDDDDVVKQIQNEK